MEKKIIMIENFFTEELLNLIDEKIKKFFSSKLDIPVFSSSILNWEHSLVKSSSPILRHILTNSDIDLLNEIKKESQNKIPYFVNDVLIHICPRLSYIPWHSDSGHAAALTVYLNKNWDPDWGGYFMYREGGEIKAVKPERNLAILQKGGIVHSLSTINMDADYRISIQCFLKSEKKIL
jgi:hypothetical protein